MPRIVSLIASATEIVDALGHWTPGGPLARMRLSGERARAASVHAPAHRCPRRQPRDRPAVKESARTSVSIYDVLDDVLERARSHAHPDADSVRCLRRKPARRGTGALRAALKAQPQIVSLQPDSLEQIWEDFRRVARALDIAEQGEAADRGD